MRLIGICAALAVAAGLLVPVARAQQSIDDIFRRADERARRDLDAARLRILEDEVAAARQRELDASIDRAYRERDLEIQLQQLRSRAEEARLLGEYCLYVGCR